MEFNINVHNATLEAQGVQEKQGDAIIKGFFGVLGFVDTPQALFPLETFRVEDNLHKEQTELVDNLPAPNVVFNIPPSEGKRPGEVKKLPKNTTASKQVDLIGKSVEPIGTLGEIATIKELKKPTIQEEIAEENTYHAAEQQSEEVEVQDHWVTGIQIGTNGEKRYRTYYWCDCGNKGKRYIEVGTNQIYCHKCSAKMWVDPATLEIDPDTALPVRDGFGNFFVAREMVDAK